MTTAKPQESTRAVEAYRAATHQAAFYGPPDAGRVRFAGADHLDFLHRLSTNHVLGLQPGSSLETVFCDNRGRIAHLCLLSRGHDEAAGDDATAGFVADPAGLLDWLERYRFSERIEWQDVTAATAQLDIVGPAAGAACRRLLDTDVEGLAPGARLPVAGPVAGLRLDAATGPGVRLWGPAADVEGLRSRLREAGLPAVDPDTWEILRVERGRPRAGRELTLDHNPWEASLAHAVHMDKGCYVGQEVVARLDTYQKVKQHLVGLRLMTPAAPGAEVEVDGRPVGKVTSTVVSPRLGPIGLAYVRTRFCPPGTLVQVAGAEARVTPLPFEPPGGA